MKMNIEIEWEPVPGDAPDEAKVLEEISNQLVGVTINYWNRDKEKTQGFRVREITRLWP